MVKSASNRDDWRNWRAAVRDYHSHEGQRVKPSLPKLKFLEKRDRDDKDREHAA